MQAFLISPPTGLYASVMQTGRPSKRPRSPFGQRLLALREVTGLSQAQVAERLGITQHAYAYWERRPVALRPEQLVQLATILKITVEELMDEAAAKRRSAGPSGKARQLFEAVSKLPRRQQEKVFSILEPFVREHGNGTNGHS
jgi:transcriptional regulator with XRE-family HTH domain